ncbi:hypothetical protein LCGC14_2135190 [marine sediment metagenome]|uniref:Uncharacterized protein n=1 Tax=marine sediment metagenome TaxID=412755 RepID=A0A0F9EMD9_9ZZZZ
MEKKQKAIIGIIGSVAVFSGIAVVYWIKRKVKALEELEELEDVITWH